MSGNPTLDIYPSPITNGDYLASFSYNGLIPQPTAAKQTPTRNILILDNSGSMGQYVKRCVTEIFPKLFSKWGCDPNEEIDLILFESKSVHHVHKVNEFAGLKYHACGGTYFAPVFGILTNILSRLPTGSNVRIVTVSDGDISDPNQTIPAAAAMNESIQNAAKFPQLNIESSAIRLFTSSYANPDTRALSSVLQFTTSSVTPTLVDIPFDIAQLGSARIWEAMKSELVESSFSNSYLAIQGVDVASKDDNNKMFKQQPWADSTVSLKLPPIGTQTLFWLNSKQFDPTKHTQFTISGVENVTANYHNILTSDDWARMIKTRIEYYMMQVKLLRVVGQESSLARLNLIAKYFIELEKHVYGEIKIVDEASDENQQIPLKQRLAQLHKKVKSTNTRLGLQMQEIVNMGQSTTFNAAQAATFLRATAGTGSSSRGLVRRAGTDLDFDNIVKGEVVELAAHFHELEAKITPELENNMNQSFISLATTMDGLRGLCSLATTDEFGDEFDSSRVHEMCEKSLLSTLTAFQILTYLNIVGVPVQSTIGDYPDPYRYNVNVVHSGHYCSLSDLMLHHEVAEGNTAAAPIKIAGQTAETGRVDSVIPVFESPEIFQFLYKYAPQTLNLYCSIGMRRMLADVPGTLPATLSAALIKLMRVVIVEPTEVNIKALSSVYSSLKVCSTIKYNTPYYEELFKAVNYYSDCQTGAVGQLVESLNATQDAPAEGGDGLVQLGTEGVAPASRSVTDMIAADAPAGTTKVLGIQSSLTQLILPLVHLYVLTEQVEQEVPNATYPAAFDDVFMKISGKTTPVATLWQVKQALPAILRAVYINEAYNTVRSVFHRKPDSTQIIQESINNLIGFDSKWEAELKPLFEDDDEFDYEKHVANAPKKFTQSSTFQSSNKKLSRLNFLIAVPAFAKLFSAFNKDQTGVIDELVSAIPQVITTPETPIMMKKAAEYTRLYNIVNKDNAQDDNNYGGFSDDENEMDDIQHSPDFIESCQGELSCLKDERDENWQMVNKNILTNFPIVFFGQKDAQITKNTITNFQLYAILTSFIYPQSKDRFVTDEIVGTTGSLVPDIRLEDLDNINNQPFFNSLIKFQKASYKSAYDTLVNAKLKSELGQVFVEYTKRLINATTIDEFKTLLKNGLMKSRCSAEFEKGFQDPHLDLFWKELINDKIEVPLRCEKLRVVISGRDENNEIVWNKGRVLFHHTLHKAAKFFYSDNQRDVWIAISEDYKIRRAQWQYRVDEHGKDLPNRHTHCNERPSYWAKGFETLDDFKAGVDNATWKAYVKEHKNCCGFKKAKK